MKRTTTLVLSFTKMGRPGVYLELAHEFMKSPSFSGKEMCGVSVQREVEKFTLPIGSICFFSFDKAANSSLAFEVKEYSSEINDDFSEEKINIYLNLSQFISYDPKKIISYLEREWSLR